jgi:hypothetical protein
MAKAFCSVLSLSAVGVYKSVASLIYSICRRCEGGKKEMPRKIEGQSHLVPPAGLIPNLDREALLLLNAVFQLLTAKI